MRLGRTRLACLVAALGLAASPGPGQEDRPFRLLFSEAEVRILPATSGPPLWALGLSLTRYGSPDDMRAVSSSLLASGEDGAEFGHGPLVEWFRSGPRGIEHGLEIRDAPAGALLAVDFTLTGSLVPKVSEDGQTVVFRDASGTSVLSCLGPQARDAEGREVDARWEKIERAVDAGPVLRLTLSGPDHAFPLSIDSRIVASKNAPARKSASIRRADAGVLSAPANDLCSGADLIPGDGPFPFLSSVLDVTGATDTGDPPAPSCQADVSRGVWFSFTPVASGAYTFTVCADAPTATTVEDTVLALYSAAGVCTGLAEVAGGCADDTCGATGLQSAIDHIELAAGATYYLVAWTYGTAALQPGAGDLQLRVVREPSAGPIPPNDQCDGAEIIPPSGPFPYLTQVTADISGATNGGDPPPPTCQSNVSRGIWYSFTPATGGRYAFSLCADGPTGSTVDDTVLALYTATAACSGIQEVPGGCDDDSCASEAAQSVLGGIDLSAGTRYYIVVWVYGTATPAAGNTAVQMRVSRVGTPPNDTCARAATLTLDTPLPGTTVAAYDDTRLPSGEACFAGIGQTPSTAGGRDVVYRFSAPADGRYSFRVSGYDASKNEVLYVASDCPSGGAPALVAGCMGAANRTATSAEEVACLPLAAGQPVYIYVDEDMATSGSAFWIEANLCQVEIEPDDAPASAGQPVCGTEGSIVPAGDVDFFALGTPASGSRVFAMVDGAAGNSSDFDLRVTTAADTLEYDDFNNDVPFGSVSPNVAGTRLNGAPSYLRVSHYSPVAQAEPYRLYVSVQPPVFSATLEFEPNDTIVTASGGANGYFSGTLSGTGDVDHFSFSAAAGDLIQIGLDLDPARDNTPFNGSLALLDASGTTLLLVNDPALSSSNVPGIGSLAAPTPYAPGEAMVYRIRDAGTYFVKVAWSAGTPGDYLLSIAHACRLGSPGDLDADGIPDADDCAPTDPTAWALPGEATGLLFPSAADTTLLDWSPPGSPGGTVVRFDLLRSETAADFQTATCVSTNSAATSGTDATSPASILYYLVRSRNVCGANAGTRSDGTPRVTRSCP